MTRLRIREAAFCILFVISNLIVSRAAEGAVEEMLTELNAKTPEERQRLIIENAKKEGEVTLYTAVNMRDAQELIGGFNKSYPRNPGGDRELGRTGRAQQSSHGVSGRRQPRRCRGA